MAFLKVSICALFGQVLPASGNAFLSKDAPKVDLHAVDLLGELERVLGTSVKAAMEDRATNIMDKMMPIYKAMPLNSADRLDPAAVRYLMHRYFVARHGWFVLGFDTAGEAWNSNPPSAVLGNSNASGVFDKLGTKGLNLHEVSLLAATLESHVHMETEDRLRAAYDILNISHLDHGTEEETVKVLDMYMMFTVLSLNRTVLANTQILKVLNRVEAIYPSWNATRKWIHEVRREVVSENPENRNSFDTTVRVVEEISDRYGRWQNQECIELKQTLMELEKPGTGRVTMHAFYKAAMGGNWQLSENIDYLRQLGSIDDTDAARPSLIIANYVNSPANCVAASSYYTVCCINECDELLGHVEQQIAAPTATPAQIISVVEKLPSASVEAPRALSEPLRDRLESIARQHGGVVPFHARLFNQWLHHAYPRECPFPHKSGTLNPMKPDKWMRSTGKSVEASKDTMQWHIDQHEQADKARLSHPDFDFDEELPWTAEEELFVSHESAGITEVGVDQTNRKTLPRTLAFVALAGAMAITMLRQLTTAKHAYDLPKHKISV